MLLQGLPKTEEVGQLRLNLMQEGGTLFAVPPSFEARVGRGSIDQLPPPWRIPPPDPIPPPMPLPDPMPPP